MSRVKAVVIAATAMLMGAGVASADPGIDQHDVQPQVRQIQTGQGVVTLVTWPERLEDQAIQAKAGSQRQVSREDAWANLRGGWISVGQGRIYVPR